MKMYIKTKNCFELKVSLTKDSIVFTQITTKKVTGKLKSLIKFYISILKGFQNEYTYDYPKKCNRKN